MRELDIAELATAGVNTIRLPVGDWMYQPYGPYVGCTDGALEEVDRLFELCRRCVRYLNPQEGVLEAPGFDSPRLAFFIRELGNEVRRPSFDDY